MVGTELLETGQLSTAIERVAAEVKAKPADMAARTFYFELLSLSGDLDRAAKQLEVLSTAQGEIGSGANVYLGAIKAEKERRQFFQGGPRPRVLGSSPNSTVYLEAIEHYAKGEFATALGLLESAAEQAEPLQGTINGAPFQELSDTNDLLAPFLEVVMDGHYSWVPWSALQTLSIPQPKYLRDTVWCPAELTLRSGGEGEVLIFALYVGSHLQADEVKLGRRTIWSVDPTEFTVAHGQKVITADATDYPILEIRRLELGPC